MENLRQVFINNLKHFRKERNIRQLDLALEIGKNSNYINSIENGKYFPSPETIEQIAAFLQIEPMQLLIVMDVKKISFRINQKNMRMNLAKNYIIA